MTNSIKCQQCDKFITSKADLVTARRAFKVYPLHRQCYSSIMKEHKFFLFNYVPINGISGNISLALTITAVVFLGLYLVPWQTALVSLLAVYTGAYRVYSIVNYEIKLP